MRQRRQEALSQAASWQKGRTIPSASTNPKASRPAAGQAGRRGPGQRGRAGTPSLPCWGERQSPGEDFHRPVPVPAVSPLVSPLLSQLRKAKTMQTLSFCAPARPVYASPAASGRGAGLLPPRRPCCAAARAGHATRACGTPAISSTRRSPSKEKNLPNSQVSPSEQASPVRRCRTEELLFFFNLSHKVQNISRSL